MEIIQIGYMRMLEVVVAELVEHQKDVVIARSVDEMGVLVTLQVHQDDMGKVIGRKGQLALALRTILRAAGTKDFATVSFKILEPQA